MATDDRFEWDTEKAAANFGKHGVAFQEAVLAFRDPFAVERFDDRRHYGERRINMLAMCRGTVHHVTYSERDGHIRIHEQDDDYRENTF